MFSLLSFGIFILVVGLIFTLNPNVFSDFSSWVTQMVDKEELIRPPDGLITSATYFFGLVGVLDFFQVAARLWAGRSKRKVLSDALSGVALIFFAYLIYLYGNYRLTWQMVLALEIVAVGLLVVLYSVVRGTWVKR
jgi:hypothetical protein